MQYQYFEHVYNKKSLMTNCNSYPLCALCEYYQSYRCCKPICPGTLSVIQCPPCPPCPECPDQPVISDECCEKIIEALNTTNEKLDNIYNELKLPRCIVAQRDDE